MRIVTMPHPSLKRLLLRKSRCQIYFEVDETTQTIRILHVWDARRERAPTLFYHLPLRCYVVCGRS